MNEVPVLTSESSAAEVQRVMGHAGEPAPTDAEEMAKPPPSGPFWTAEEVRVAASITNALGETESRVARKILQVVHALGETQAQALLAQTVALEANGGMLVLDGSRRRTAGGVFFRLAYTIGEPKPGRVSPRPPYTDWKARKQERRAARAATPPFT